MVPDILERYSSQVNAFELEGMGQRPQDDSPRGGTMRQAFVPSLVVTVPNPDLACLEGDRRQPVAPPPIGLIFFPGCDPQFLVDCRPLQQGDRKHCF